MIQKIANIAFIICGVCIVVPNLMLFFTQEEGTILTTFPWGVLILVSGFIGITIQILTAVKNKSAFTLSSVLLILAFLLLMLGFAFKEWNLMATNPVLIAAVVSFFGWFLIPSKRNVEEE